MTRASKQEARSDFSTKLRRPQQAGIPHSSQLPSPVAQRALAAPEALTPADVLMLQRTIGNQSTAKLLAPVRQPEPVNPPVSLNQANPLVLQRKRDINAIEQEELEGHHRTRNKVAEKEEIEANYNKSLASGNKLKTKGLKWYTGDHDAEQPVTDTEDKVANAGYKDFWFMNPWPEITLNTHRGPEVEALVSGEVDGYDISDDFDDDQDYMYSNSFNVETGEFHAGNNYREWDTKVAKKEGLPPALNNSEIIWHQYKLAQRVAAEKEKKSGKDDFKPSRLTSISREDISNAQTLDTIFLTNKGGAVARGETVRLDDGNDDDVWALLGTPNGNSAVWLLMQHGEEFGAVDIESVTYKKDKLTIRYRFDD